MRLSRPALLLLTLLLSVGCSIDRSGLRVRRSAMDGGRDADARDGGTDPSDALVPDAASPSDAGEPPRSFYELSWEAPEELSLGREAPCDRVFDLLLSDDRRWLLASYFEDGSCAARRFHLFEWDDGEPTWVSMLGPIHPGDTEHNGHLVRGVAAGRPGDHLLYHTFGGDSGGNRALGYVWLSGDPPSVSGPPEPLVVLNEGTDDSGPTLTRDGTRIVFDRDGDLFAAAGVPPASFAAPTLLTEVSSGQGELDPALSPDGRVLVFSRLDGDWDLWVARRAEVDAPFETPVRLPDPLNSALHEWDAFLASNGDLLFTRRDGGGTQKAFLARAVLP